MMASWLTNPTLTGPQPDDQMPLRRRDRRCRYQPTTKPGPGAQKAKGPGVIVALDGLWMGSFYWGPLSSSDVRQDRALPRIWSIQNEVVRLK